MISLQREHALDVFKVVPDPTRGQYLEPGIFRSYVRFVLGDVDHAGLPCSRCGAAMDRLGAHAVHCPVGRNRTKKHNEVVHIAGDHLNAGEYSVARDAAIDPLVPLRPADLLVPRFVEGREAAMDITIISPLQHSLVDKAAEDKNAVFAEGEKRKEKKYAALCATRDVVFIPLVATTYGGWSDRAMATFERIIAAEANNLHLPLASVRNNFYGQMAVAIARYTAWAILDRRPVRRLARRFVDA
jgi:hypothetical protein